MRLQLSEIAQWLGSTVQGEDVSFNGIAIDSREVQPGQCFVAFAGERVDGHDFAEKAKAAGAVALIVAHDVETDLPTIKVKDTTQALTVIAENIREKVDIPFVAITGSSGKTTTRNILAAILRQAYKVLVSQKNYNTSVSVPLTLSAIESEDKFAIIEMGARHKGDVAELCRLVHPKVATITNIAPVHVEAFGFGVLGIAKAKGEIFEGLNDDGIAVINAAEPYAEDWRALLKDQGVIYFGSPDANVYAKNIQFDDLVRAKFVLVTPFYEVEVKLQLIGEHQVNNAVCAAALATALGIDVDQIRAGLEAAQAEKGRMQAFELPQGSLLIDDTYNGSGMLKAIEALSRCQGKRILVVGDMAELGDDRETQHREVGEKARELSIDRLFAVGPQSVSAVKAFGEGAVHFESKPDLIKALLPELKQGAAILVKGSRGMQMEEVCQAVRSTKP